MKIKNLRIFNSGKWQAASLRVWKEGKWVSVTGWPGAEVKTNPIPYYPPAFDEVQAQLRPSTAAAITIRVGPTRECKDITAAISVVQSARKQQKPSPDTRADIIVDSGAYQLTANPFMPHYVNIIGSTGDPNDVLITGQYETNSLGVLTTTGTNYFEGISLIKHASVAPVAWLPKYPVHHALNGTSIYSRCKLIGPGTSIGADGGDGGVLMFHSCHLDNGVNLHGPNTSVTSPIQLIAVDTTAASWGFGAFGRDGAGADVYVMGASEISRVINDSPSGKTFIDPTAVVRSKPANAIVEENYPLPRNGLSAYERKKLYG